MTPFLCGILSLGKFCLDLSRVASGFLHLLSNLKVLLNKGCNMLKVWKALQIWIDFMTQLPPFTKKNIQNNKFLVSPVSRKSPWINFGLKKVKLERNADNSGRESWAWIFWVGWKFLTLEKQGRKIRYQNSPSKFAEKFAGNFSTIRRAKIKNSPLCITSGPINSSEQLFRTIWAGFLSHATGKQAEVREKKSKKFM